VIGWSPAELASAYSFGGVARLNERSKRAGAAVELRHIADDRTLSQMHESRDAASLRVLPSVEPSMAPT
jgi:hypothetical protein